MATVTHDVIAAEVHRKALQNLTNEMATTLVRTSGSPIVTEAKDFSTCLLDTGPEHLAYSAYVLLHVGSSLLGTESIAAGIDAAQLRPGDGWIVNDPHSAGAMHQGDVSVIMPTFYGDDHLGWSFANMHVLDVGGVGISGYAPGAHDVYQEGIRFPPVKIIRDGKIDPEWETFIAANVRTPGPVLNDIRSMIAANNTAARKLREIVDEFGLERHHEFCEINKNLTEHAFRERIANLPDGAYEAVEWNEFDGHDGPDRLLELKLRLEISGSDMKFSYSGVPQIDAYVNSTRGAMFGQTMTALLTLLAYGDLAVNGGLWRPLTLDLGEPGTIVNAQEPAPVSNAHCEVGARACRLTKDVLCQALALSDDPVLRGRVAGMCQDAFPGSAVAGPNQHGGTSVMFYADNAIGSGGGAQTIHDGQDGYGMTCAPGGGIPDIEGHESADPVLFLWRRIVPNSGGPGRMRGGQAIEEAYVVNYGEGVAGPAFNACAQVPPRGAGGGYPGGAATYYPIRDTNVAELLAADTFPRIDRVDGRKELVRSKIAHIEFRHGDAVVITSGGGGGLGDPLLRPIETVVEDCRAGYVTPEHASAIYGVELGPDGGADIDATAARRAEILRERIGGEATKELRPPASAGTSVVHADGKWACASCDEALCDVDQNWREHAVSSERPVGERFGELGMVVRDRSEEPYVVTREHFCPVCAAVLGVDVVTAGLESLPSPQLA